MKILIPTVIPLDVEVPEGARRVDYDVAYPIPAEHRDAEAVVVWLNPGERLRALPAELPEVRWVQGLMAGTDSVQAAGFADDVVITGGTGLHNDPVAEHTLALILAAARRLDEAFEAQHRHEWLSAHTGNQIIDRDGFTTLAGARVVIWGFGEIGSTLAGYLAALGAQVVGVARTAGTRHGFRVIEESGLAQELPRTDVLVDILPAGERTNGIVDAAILAALPPHAWFVNVGRGATVVEDDLVAALTQGRIGGAALDVFVTEPLPADSPLWSAPNTLITPHSAGGRPRDAGQRITANLHRYLAGEPLIGTVER